MVAIWIFETGRPSCALPVFRSGNCTFFQNKHFLIPHIMFTFFLVTQKMCRSGVLHDHRDTSLKEFVWVPQLRASAGNDCCHVGFPDRHKSGARRNAQNVATFFHGFLEGRSRRWASAETFAARRYTNVVTVTSTLSVGTVEPLEVFRE